VGEGPDSPEQCAPEAAFGDEAIVLILHGERHDQEVFVRYAGCNRHGIDDGATHRKLTSSMLWGLMTSRGPHRFLEISDPAVARLMPLY
jgi:hypothetical protein